MNRLTLMAAAMAVFVLGFVLFGESIEAEEQAFFACPDTDFRPDMVTTDTIMADPGETLTIKDGEGNTVIVISVSGSVGIAKATPTVELDVLGDGNFSGDLNVEGNYEINGDPGWSGMIYPYEGTLVSGGLVCGKFAP